MHHRPSWIATAAVQAALVACAASACDTASSGSDFTLDRLMRGCASATACGIGAHSRVGDCVKAYRSLIKPRGEGPLAQKAYECAIAAAGDCAKVGACFGDGSSCDRSFRASCKGTTGIGCDLLDRRVYRKECGAAGLTCTVDKAASFSIRCGCDASFAGRCHAGWAIGCSSGRPTAIDCAAQGGRCEDGRCTSGSVDACGVDPTGSGCSGKGSACSGDDLDRCQGDKLKSCVDGLWRTIDCRALGFGPCVAVPLPGSQKTADCAVQ